MTPTQKIEFLGVILDSLIMALSPCLYQRRKSLELGLNLELKQYLELPQKTQVSILELTKLIGLLSSTNQAVLPAQINFRYLQQQIYKH